MVLRVLQEAILATLRESWRGKRRSLRFHTVGMETNPYSNGFGTAAFSPRALRASSFKSASVIDGR